MPKCDFNKVAKQFYNFKVLVYIAVLVFNLVWYFQCETELIVSRRSCICELKFIKRQINKPKSCFIIKSNYLVLI